MNGHDRRQSPARHLRRFRALPPIPGVSCLRRSRTRPCGTRHCFGPARRPGQRRPAGAHRRRVRAAAVVGAGAGLDSPGSARLRDHRRGRRSRRAGHPVRSLGLAPGGRRGRQRRPHPRAARGVARGVRACAGAARIHLFRVARSHRLRGRHREPQGRRRTNRGRGGARRARRGRQHRAHPALGARSRQVQCARRRRAGSGHRPDQGRQHRARRRRPRPRLARRPHRCRQGRCGAEGLPAQRPLRDARQARPVLSRLRLRPRTPPDPARADVRGLGRRTPRSPHRVLDRRHRELPVRPRRAGARGGHRFESPVADP